MWWEVFMRILFFPVAAVLCLMASAAPAQQSPPTTGDTIGHPPPLPGPPPLSQPSSTTQSTPAASTPRATEPAPKGYTGAYAPAGTPPIPYSTGPLPEPVQGPGLNVIAADGVSTSRLCLAEWPRERPMDPRPVWESPIKVQEGVGASQRLYNGAAQAAPV